MIEHEGEGADHAQSVTNEVDLTFGGDAADVGETAAGHQVYRGFGEAAGDVLEHAVVCAVSDGCDCGSPDFAAEQKNGRGEGTEQGEFVRAWFWQACLE